MSKRAYLTLVAASALLLTACSDGSEPGPAEGPAEGPTKVSIVSGNQSPDVSTWQVYLPEMLKYWEDEGLDVTVNYTQGSPAAVQGLVAGQADFAFSTLTPVLAASSDGEDVRPVVNQTVMAWRLAVPTDSAIKDPGDLKGAKIGLFAAGAGSQPYLERWLTDAGIDIQTDIEYIVTGGAAASYEALKNGTVDVAFSFIDMLGQMEALGGEYRYLADDKWLKMPDYGLSTSTKMIKDRDTLVAVSRGVAKAMVFLTENPRCAAEVFMKTPTGMGGSVDQFEAALRASAKQAKASFDSQGTGYWGFVEPSRLQAAIDLQLDLGLISKKLDAKAMVPGDLELAKAVNDFDADEIRAAARACDLG
ncbi:ABC transporter substrate-binding protein [Diaminobutyricimonas sp. LJ205]|uniref:ABC transporter substrate-binding protein n=1 Tax=Diaminobutyricimonas sp. LJ205 TaxID=2683590 RepID=UPI0012F49099|nr:ABC transporter substrate-binding protein [Diaminobutyricimonas sp. LJ205]